MSIKNIAVIGGTFDPFHNGHLAIGIQLHEIIGFNKILYMPCKHPNSQKQPIAKPKQRLEMTRLGIESHKNLRVSALEIDRPGITYTIDTVRVLRSLYSDASITLVVGDDTFQYLNQWLHWFTILQYVHILVINRPHFLLTRTAWLNKLLQQHETFSIDTLLKNRAGAIYFQTLNTPAISSTEIRQKIKNGIDVSTLLPSNINQFITKLNLYRGRD